MNLSGTSEILRTMKTELPGVLSQWQNSMETDGMDLLEEDAETIFDKAYVRAIFITLYTLVFSFCFFGNLAVVLVVTLHWKMRSITKFCIGNLAFANLCVGIFCVYQNLSTFLIDRWVFGSFMCKMYHFINSLSHTTSILILVVICVERYVAILHPFKSRKWVTLSKLKVVIVTVWILSAIICAPRLYYINIINFPVTASPGKVLRYDMICAPQHSLYNAPMMDMGYFILLFILPLLVISILYTRISIYVWRSSRLFRGGSTGASFGSESYTSQKSTISVTQKFNRFSRSCSKRERRTVRFSTTFEDDSNSFKDNDRESPENDSLISDLESTGSTVFSDSLEPPPSKCSHARIRFSVRLSIFRRSGSKKQRCRSKGNSSGSPKTLKKNPLQSSRQEFKELLGNFPGGKSLKKLTSSIHPRFYIGSFAGGVSPAVGILQEGGGSVGKIRLHAGSLCE
ncbi:unnamed protein product [Allacma fusca]|uniref:G-protein coupled receptors family 1 profile domain-containing protein n=1 Tax=Allacma fusca TaxID=39272 RepID=A0A8J2NZN6_9HEXA|nr:unnamed protein product [Allacma fusca]